MKAEVSITKPGHFAAKLVRIDLHRLWMQGFAETLPRVAHVTLVPGRAVISIPLQANRSSNSGAIETPLPASFQRFSEAYSGFSRSTGPIQSGSMSLAIADMEALGASYGGSDFTPPRESLRIHPPVGAMERLRSLHLEAQHLAEHAPEMITNAEAARGMEQALITAMADCLCDPDARQTGIANQHHAKIMRRFHAMLEEHPNDVLHTTDLCREIGVSRRTLNTCCNDALGMSPHRYLKIRQLNLAHRALARADAATATVTDIATAHGFWELGRFAIAHRALFGEPPSVTLQRR